MTNGEEQMTFGESSTVIAAQLVQLYGHEAASRAARYQVRAYAFGENDLDGRVIAFWANVLTRVAELSVAELEISPFRAAALETLIRRSSPQAATIHYVKKAKAQVTTSAHERSEAAAV